MIFCLGCSNRGHFDPLPNKQWLCLTSDVIFLLQQIHYNYRNVVQYLDICFTLSC